MKWLKKDDNVMVIAGNDKGKVGLIMAIIKNRVIVKGVNVRKKNVKSSNQKQASQVVYIEMPIAISNVALCNADGEKIKKLTLKKTNKEKQLVFMENGKELVYRILYKKR